MIRAGLVAFALCAGAVQAQDVPVGGMVSACDDATRADTIVEPWAENSATYAGGAIRVALLDMVEPAAAAFRLLIISPPHDELGIRQCRVVEAGDGLGFYSLDFTARTASYDPSRGLTLTMPARRYLPETDMGGDDGWFQLSIQINQQSGDIAVQGFK